jgi:hypothetical protein
MRDATAGSGLENIEGFRNYGGVYGYDAALTSDQMNRLLSEDSPYLQRARLSGEMQAAARGLTNSSMGVFAGEAAAIDAAAQVAKYDVDSINQARQDLTNSVNKARSEEVRNQIDINIDYVGRVDKAAAFTAGEINKSLVDYAQRVDLAAKFYSEALNLASLDYAKRSDEALKFNAEQSLIALMDNARRADNLAIANAELEFKARELYATGRQKEAESLLELAKFNQEQLNKARGLNAQILADLETREDQQGFDYALAKWKYAVGERSADAAFEREAALVAQKYEWESTLIDERGEWDMDKIRAQGELDLTLKNRELWSRESIAAADRVSQEGIAAGDRQSRETIAKLQIGQDVDKTRFEVGLRVLELWENSTQFLVKNSTDSSVISNNDLYWNSVLGMMSGGTMQVIRETPPPTNPGDDE